VFLHQKEGYEVLSFLMAGIQGKTVSSPRGGVNR